jgi:DNA excision repair protein ERCC-2
MISDERKKELLFPYEVVRNEQNKLILLTDATLQNKRNLIVHAPTGLGKTAAALAPALAYAIKHDKTVMFLTSRHTQHKVAIDTLKLIKEKFNINVSGTSIIGKKWMCSQPGIQTMYSGDFSEYCKKLKEDKKCNFYTNARKNQTTFTLPAINTLKILNNSGPYTSEEVFDRSRIEEMCPYEISIGMAAKSKVIITDYYYLFHPNIGDNFLAKIGKDMKDIIVIVDEAHNLPYRLKDLASEFLTTITIKRAITEAKKYGYDNTLKVLQDLLELLEKIAGGLEIGKERTLTRNVFESPLNDAYDYDQLISDFKFIADAVRELQKTSYIGSIADFLEKWQGQDDGFVRIISNKKGIRENFINLSYRCLDPSVISSDVIDNTHSTILMSGTLLPTGMYKELLGVDECQEVVFKDPFPKKNRINMIIPKTTTKYSERSETQYKNIAEILSNVTNKIPGNSAIFFPSYYLRDQISKFFDQKSEKTLFNESKGLTKSDKEDMLSRFKEYKDIGAVLLAVASGSFGEGIDLPGDLLKCVIIVGLPLSSPDLETKSLIDYFDKKFGKGWDYGYLFPAFNKTLQNAGRCIRSGTDKGIIVFLDERYTWKNYKRCFPEDWDLEIASEYTGLIDRFFKQ